MAATSLTGYCMKCKTHREIKDPKQITKKNGRPSRRVLHGLRHQAIPIGAAK